MDKLVLTVVSTSPAAGEEPGFLKRVPAAAGGKISAIPGAKRPT
jgi:hypothetical protein